MTDEKEAAPPYEDDETGDEPVAQKPCTDDHAGPDSEKEKGE